MEIRRQYWILTSDLDPHQWASDTPICTPKRLDVGALSRTMLSDKLLMFTLIIVQYAQKCRPVVRIRFPSSPKLYSAI